MNKFMKTIALSMAMLCLGAGAAGAPIKGQLTAGPRVKVVRHVPAGPAGTPAAIVARLNAEINAAVSDPEVRRKAEAGGDYNVALVDLAEGPRMMSRVEGMAPADVKIGMAVKAEVIAHNGKGLVVFKAA